MTKANEGWTTPHMAAPMKPVKIHQTYVEDLREGDQRGGI